MPMDQSGSDGCAQVIHAPCCTMTQTEIAMSASPAKTHAGNMIAHVELPSLLLPIDLHPVSAWFVEFPPGNTLTGPVLSRLCSFQI